WGARHRFSRRSRIRKKRFGFQEDAKQKSFCGAKNFENLNPSPPKISVDALENKIGFSKSIRRRAPTPGSVAGLPRSLSIHVAFRRIWPCKARTERTLI